MEPIPPDAFDKLPKVLWENSRVAYSDNFVLVAIKNGAGIGVQMLTPEHMKQITQMFQFNLDEYEKTHGEIKSNWSPGTPSPIQVSNSGKN